MKTLRLLAILLFISLSGRSQIFTWTGVEPILNNQTDTIYLNVSGLPNSIDTTFGLVHVCFDITHTAIGDLWLYIVAPDGSSRTLLSNKGGEMDNYTNTCLGMDGTHLDNTKPPYQGIFEPDADISTLNNGQNPNGIWKFVVTDNAAADTGSIRRVSIEFGLDPPQGVPPTNFNVPGGPFVRAGIQCKGGATNCDLLPDLTSSYKDIFLNHTETPGFLDISNTTPNIGNGPIEIFAIDSCYCGTTHVPCSTASSCTSGFKHVIMQRIYQKRAGTDTLGYFDRPAGLMTYHPSHGHLHVDNWVSYTLRTPTANPDARTWPIIATGTKQSYCLVNINQCSASPGMCKEANGDTVLTAQNHGFGFRTGCTTTQGIYAGYYDTYGAGLNEPIPLPSGICNGTYYVVSITDPDNIFLESDETNNWVAVPVNLTQQNPAPVITASGPTTICAGDSVTLTSSIANNYAWSTGATTRSITVKQAGTYTISTTCGSTMTTSAPMTVNVAQITTNPVPATPACNGDAVTLNAGTVPGTTQNTPVQFTSSTQVFIPDFSSTTGAGIANSTIAVSGISPATLTTSSVVSVQIYVTHTYDGDLEISLISPSGNQVMLSNRRGGSGDNFNNTTFSMSAATLITSGSPPFAGTYRPDGNFASFTGNANGNWTLRVRDLAGADTGRVRGWNIRINNLTTETFSYVWSGTGGFSSVAATPSVSPTITSAYTAVITSGATGCTTSATINVNVPDTLLVTGVFPPSAMGGQLVSIYGRGFNGASSVSIGGVSSGFMVMNDGHIQAMVPGGGSGPQTVCVTNATNCNRCGTTSLSVQSSIAFNVKLFIQGFYRGASSMQATVDPNRNPALCDTVTIELHEALPPYALASSYKAVLNTSGTVNLWLPPAYDGASFYISIHHRNALETWSANAVTITSGGSYDFTDAAGKAHGANQFALSDGKFALYSGDICNSTLDLIHDGAINLYDLSMLGTHCGGFSSGYSIADITGDLISESTDYSFLENNIPLNISVSKP